MSESSLYGRIGGRDGVEAVVDAFYERALADERLAHHFDPVDVDRLRAHQRTFLSSVTAGPAEDDGRNLREAHAPLDLTASDYAAVVDHLDAALRAFDVADDDRAPVLDLVAGLEGDVLGR